MQIRLASNAHFYWRRVLLLLALPMLLLEVGARDAQAQPAASAPTEMANGQGGPIRIRQPQPTENDQRGRRSLPEANPPVATPYKPGDFERFVQRQAGATQEIRRFGSELMSRGAEQDAAETSPLVPPDYPVAPGDEVLVTIWGSVDADLRLIVDRSGRIGIPRVGTIAVAGVRYSELASVIGKRVAQVFRNYELSVALGALRGIRVFVTGFVATPGAYQVTSLSTVTTALMRAGGPTAAGSFRRIDLMRNGQAVSTFDLYDFLLKGDRSADRLLQAGDVIQVGPVGVEIGLIGSVNRVGVLEVKEGETVADVLRMAGGLTAVADRSRLAVERLVDRSAARIRELSLPRDLAATPSHGDIVRAFSAVDAVLPIQRQNKRVRIEGEVARPGDYILPPTSMIADAVAAAGGLTQGAFIFGTEFTRESVRATQQENYDRALRDLETEFARQGAQRSGTAEEAAVSAARSAATNRLVERLRVVRPSGRIVLQISPGSSDLPQLALEDGDRLFVPPRPTTVGVFGSVFNGGSYLFGSGRKVEDYLRLAGGPTRGADQDSTFVIRANGSVVSNLQGRTSWWSAGNSLGPIQAEPGDTIFVPEEINKSTFTQNAKDWTQILYQFGLGVAGIKAVGL